MTQTAPYDWVWTHANLCIDGVELIEDGMLAIADGRIAFVGKSHPGPWRAKTHIDAQGLWVSAGLVDCHTHLVFGGDRSLDFDLKTQGVSYADIAAQGGGIRSTVAHTQACSEEALVDSALGRIDALIDSGVTTVEIKSGYGLTLADEIKMLKAAKRLESLRDISVVTTYLALHALPDSHRQQRHQFVEAVTQEWLPEIAQSKLCTQVDVFCEQIAFTPDECRRVLQQAQRLSLATKVHADQLRQFGGAQLAAEVGALSADHVEYTDEAGVKALAQANTVATVLPGAFLMLQEKQRPPLQLLREHGVPIAVATDLNPGSSPLTSLTLAATLARAQFGLTAHEALQGITLNAARALGLADRGQLTVGARADLCFWAIRHPRELSYWLGQRPPVSRVFNGQVALGDFRDRVIPPPK